MHFSVLRDQLSFVKAVAISWPFGSVGKSLTDSLLDSVQGGNNLRPIRRTKDYSSCKTSKSSGAVFLLSLVLTYK